MLLFLRSLVVLFLAWRTFFQFRCCTQLIRKLKNFTDSKQINFPFADTNTQEDDPRSIKVSWYKLVHEYDVNVYEQMMFYVKWWNDVEHIKARQLDMMSIRKDNGISGQWKSLSILFEQDRESSQKNNDKFYTPINKS